MAWTPSEHAGSGWLAWVGGCGYGRSHRRQEGGQRLRGFTDWTREGEAEKKGRRKEEGK